MTLKQATTVDKNTPILSADDIERKTKRIAYQIVENNYDEKEVILVGVREKGLIWAEMLRKAIESIGVVPVKLYEIKLDKKNPIKSGIACSIEAKDLKKKSVVLVDDVANTGRTLAYALKPLLDGEPKKIQVAVLVDRRHKGFPITADFVGLSLTTTLREHISVSFEAGKEGAFLS